MFAKHYRHNGIAFMDETPHDFSAQPIDIRYDFKSVSDAKTISKIVRFTESRLPAVFNVALLDLMDDGTESDMNVTNNDDMRTVLATVMRITDNFLAKFPQKIVAFTGSDDRRIRLYRIVISRELIAIKKRFKVIGELLGGEVEDFQPNQNYLHFYIALKA